MRLQAVQQAIAAGDIDVVALGPGWHMHYLLGFHPHPDERPCLLCVTADKAAMLMPALNAEEARAKVDLPFHTYADADGPQRALAVLCRDLALPVAPCLAVDEAMRADFALLMQRASGAARTSLAGDLISPLRRRKDADELARIAVEAHRADQAMQAGFRAVAPGATEQDVARAVEARFAELGATKLLFAIVGSGPNGAFPHHATGTRRLQAGDPVVIDIGATAGVYSSDITRMAVLGEPSETYRRVHATVDAAVRAALDVIRPGVVAKDVDRAARSVIEQAGYGPYFVHRTGHGLGLEGHEPPYITATSEDVLDEGAVFSVEPGIYLPGEFGVRLEEIVTVTADGARVFSSLTREPHIVAV